MAIGFIKLFIHWKPVISLEQAAQKLTQGEELHKLKTKIRRLYDIANVFLALGIIKKAYLLTRKPAFSWVGLDGLAQVLNKLLYGYSVVQKDQKQISLFFSDYFNIDSKIHELLGKVVVSTSTRASNFKNDEIDSINKEDLKNCFEGSMSTSFVTKKSAFSICQKYFRPFDKTIIQQTVSTKCPKDSSCKSTNSSN